MSLSGKIRLFISAFSLLLLFSSINPSTSSASGSHPPLIPAPPVPPVVACPADYVGVIQSIDPDNQIRCYGATGGMGFSTFGLQRICGPVLCPVEPAHDNLSRGQSCIRQDAGGVCHPGTGASGFFDKSSDPGACIPNNAVKINCPPFWPLYLKTTDDKGNPQPGFVQILYGDAPPYHTNAKSVIINTSKAGSDGIYRVDGILHAGDHFVIVPQQNFSGIFSQGDKPSVTLVPDITASISALEVGNTYKFFQNEVDTPFSCGSSAADPCNVVLFESGSALPSVNLLIYVIILVVIIFLLFYEENKQKSQN